MAEPYISLDDLKQSGESLLAILRDCEPSLDYDEQSISWLDGYIQRNRHTFSDGSKHGVAIGIGAVVGEVMLRNFGGAWEYLDDQEQWFVNLGDGLGKCNPIGKSCKALNDETESVSAFFRFAREVVIRGGLDHIGSKTGDAD